MNIALTIGQAILYVWNVHMIKYDESEIELAYQSMSVTRRHKSDWPKTANEAMQNPMTAALLRSVAMRNRRQVQSARIVDPRPDQTRFDYKKAQANDDS